MKFCNMHSIFLSLLGSSNQNYQSLCTRLLLKRKGKNTELYINKKGWDVSFAAGLWAPQQWGFLRMSTWVSLGYYCARPPRMGAGGRSCSEVLRKLTGLTTPSPIQPLWPSHVHIRGHFYGNAMFTWMGENLLFAILVIKAKTNYVLFYFTRFLSALFLFLLVSWFSNGKQIDVHTRDKTDPQDSK